MDMEDDRISYDSDEERQRKREEEKETRRIAKLRAAMLVVAADDWLREDKIGQLDEEIIGMMERPDEIDPRDWEDAKVILADYKKYDFSDYWTSRLMPKEDGQETDLPKPDISYLGKSTAVTCREVSPFLTQAIQRSPRPVYSLVPEGAADDTTEVKKLTTAKELGNAFIRDNGGSSAANICQMADGNKPLKSCFKDPKVSLLGRPTRKVSFGIRLVEVYYMTNEEREFKKLDCDNDFVECNGRKLRDMSSSEIRMEELDNLDLFLARKLKYKQVQDFPVEVEVREEPKKEEKKKAPARKPVIVTCDMVKKEMAKNKAKRTADDTPTPHVNGSMISSSEVKTDCQTPLPSGPCNTSGIVIPHTRTLQSETLPAEEAFRKQETYEPAVDRMKRRLRHANNTNDLANQTSVESKDNGIPLVRRAFGAQGGKHKKKRQKPKPQKLASDITVMEVQSVEESDQTHSVSEGKLKTADPKLPNNCAEDRKWRKITPRVTPRSGDTDTVPILTRHEEQAIDKPRKHLHRSSETTETKGARNNRTREQKAVDDEFDHLRTTGPRVIYVRSKTENGSVEWDNTCLDVYEPMQNECHEKNGEKGGLERDTFVEKAKVERNGNDRSGLKNDKTGRKKKSKNCKKAAECRIIEVKPVEDGSHQWDNTFTPETSPTPANRDTTSVPTSKMPTSSDFNPIQDSTSEVKRGCPKSETTNPSTATADSRPSDPRGPQSTSIQSGSDLRIPPKVNLSSRLRNLSRRFRQGLSNVGHRLRRLCCLPNKST